MRHPYADRNYEYRKPKSLLKKIGVLAFALTLLFFLGLFFIPERYIPLSLLSLKDRITDIVDQVLQRE